MATYLEVVNNLQRRLRETVTASVTTSEYSQLLGIFVNDAKRKIENHYPWSFNRATGTATIPADDVTTTIGTTRHGSKVLAVWNDTGSYWLQPGSLSKAQLNFNKASPDTGLPREYSIYHQATSEPLVIYVYPKNTGTAQSLIATLHTPSADLTGDAQDTLPFPEYVLELGAYLLAVSERGEDGGKLYDETVQEYNRMLSLMVAQEQASNPAAFDWNNEEIWRSR